MSMIITMPPPTIAVIIPVFNRIQMVIDALESVAAQSLLPTQVIVVDDGSTDNTADEVQRWFARDGLAFETCLIRQANLGAATARNRGIERVSGTGLIAFLDSDDLWPVDYLERARNCMVESTDAIAASCDWISVDAEGDRQRLVHLGHITQRTTEKFFLDDRPKISGTVCRRWAVRKINGFEAASQPGEAHQFLLRLSLIGPWCYMRGLPIIYRCVRDDSQDDGPYSRKYAQRLLIRAQLSDDLITREGGDRAISAHLWRPHLARMWYRAGRRSIKLGNVEAAQYCFHRATQLRPWGIKGQWWRLRLALRT